MKPLSSPTSSAPRRRRVVITGVGPVSPVAVGRQSFWNAIQEGRSGTVALTSLPGGFPVETLRSRVAGIIPDALLPEDPRRVTDRRGLLAELALDLALRDADLRSLEGARSAVVMGNAVGAVMAMEAAFRAREREPSARPVEAPGSLARQFSYHTVAHELAARCGAEGLVLTMSTGCTASLDAISAAFDLVRSGQVDVAVTGSAEAPLTSMCFASFDVIGATSRRNDSPATASRPFDKQRDGFVAAEGAAIVVLEELERARARGARILAELVGAASSCNAYHMTNLTVDGEDLAHCIRLALEDARLPPDAVDHVSAHGSSTPQNDLFETNAIKVALGARARRITVNSLKSMLGHALGASNALEVVACALSLAHQRHHPTINLDEPGEGCDLDYVAKEARSGSFQHALKLCNSFSGIHSALVMAAL
ncbi:MULTISPECIES: beta-ketoacyl-[acyl-carrier-protein] synthase family protein [unclassified Corallococcus]|uniref:beta-ketoacyl-[acyl-carrier-protein] synthase family protein n=1 Tax=unclassified Corallococcus TaxID=2685029 RepID=UPI001A90B5BA|nr:MULTISPECIES: beta-ketoacyl-[acyl-carrier-protein] synthase family protein [unclassified Corallococcus]MBN9684648.1 beta-ketoacyl-[acyl-carrier-protein] synthase family protein [Corallococcus sp. NCSPR001]WAS83881.1 beta-ketoacyl-[acyl-carrier-protein] synthase family protein [Corallococcus sp. NCRR]